MDDEFKIDMDETKSGDEKPEAPVGAFGIADTFKRSLLVNPMTFVPVVLAVLLWMVTAWIPFINIGTTIALFTLPVWLADGRKISPIEIFLAEHRAKLESFLLLSAVFTAVSLAAWGLFSGMGVAPRFCGTMSRCSAFWFQMRLLLAMAAALTPLAMVGTAWSMAYFLLLEKGLGPLEAIQASAELTRGSRLKILVVFGLPVALGIVLCMIFSFVPYVRWILMLATLLAMVSVLAKLAGTVYGALRAGTTPAA